MTSAAAMKPRGMATTAANGPTGAAVHRVVRAGDDDAPAGGGIVAPVELAGGKNPREQGGHDDRPAQKDDGMRQTQSCRSGRQGARIVLLVCYLGVSAI